MFRSSLTFDKLLDKATSHLHLEPDWVAILQICDLIRQGDVQPKAALAAIKKKMTNANPHVALFALLVLESCVKNCGTLIHDEIGTKQYMEQLKELVKTTTHENVKLKTLELIQAWAHAFRNSPKYRAVQDTLNIMKAEGHKFPTLKESDAMFIADTAPAWADGDVCHRCRVSFGMVQRKHHCRACGQVFCSQCSSKVSTLPKFGIEKEVRVCEACYEQLNKPSTAQIKEADLPAEYLNSSLAQQQQVPPRKTAAELQEEEELNLAIALSQSEAEHQEKEKKRGNRATKINPPNTRVVRTSSPPPSPQEEAEVDPELAKYLNRKRWELRQSVLEEHSSRADVTSPSAPNISSPMPQKVIITKQQNGEVDNQMEEFVNALRSQVEIFVNRMKSNSSRGRSIANDSSVQTLFLNITAMHSRLLRYIQEQDDSRVYYEGLQDKLTQMKDARAALDALREEHREKLRRQAEEAERQRQMLMAQKLAIMRKKKQEYLQYQRQLALQKIQEQEREMQMRQEQQKQQYIMGGYQAVSGFIGPSQGSPVRHVQYQTPGTNYNPMSPTNQGFIYGQPSMKQYPMQGYNIPPMNSIPPHVMGPITNQEQPTDSVQGHEAMGRVSVSGPGMMSQITNPIPQLQQTGGHQMGPPSQQGPPPSGNVVARNGGVPQLGNLTKHLQVFRDHLINQIPDKSFPGVGVIDFESWRPIFRQNWASLQPYKKLSIDVVRREHPSWGDQRVEQEAKRRFEKYGKLFMEETLKAAKRMRPAANWGYYAYPYCYNLTPNQPSSQCEATTMQENDKMSWLFESEDVLLPSVYLRWNLTSGERVGLVGGRVKEALRIARQMTTSRKKVLPYYWYKYQDRRDTDLSRADLEATLRKITDLGADGFIIWGSSNDINTKAKCVQFREYLNNDLGPVVKRIALNSNAPAAKSRLDVSVDQV